MSSTLNLAVQIVEFILAIGVMAFLHESGHFLMSRLFHIEVEEFGFGFPPRLTKLFTWKGTDFTLNWIPFGAFVRPKGENDPTVVGGLGASNPWARLLVFLGGPLMNILTGIIIFAVVFTHTGMPDSSVVQIVEISPASPAAIANLQAGDVITTVNHQKIDNMTSLSKIVQANLGKPVVLEYLRNNKPGQVQITPRTNPPQGQGAMGIVMGNPIVTISWFQALPYAGSMALDQAAQLVMLPVRLIEGNVNQNEVRFVGPKGMFDIYQQAQTQDAQASSSSSSSSTSSGSVNTLWFLAVVSVAFGLTNLLPLPALDGGHILFVLPEILFHRRVPVQFENMVHMIGFLALIALMVFITTQDIISPIKLP
jgi:regulator of sigma E protease